jgi:hypothetical protein
MRIGSASSKFSSVAPLPFRRAGLGGAKSFASEHALAGPLERPRALFDERIDLLATVEREGHLSGKATVGRLLGSRANPRFDASSHSHGVTLRPEK